MSLCHFWTLVKPEMEHPKVGFGRWVYWKLHFFGWMFIFRTVELYQFVLRGQNRLQLALLHPIWSRNVGWTPNMTRSPIEKIRSRFWGPHIPRISPNADFSPVRHSFILLTPMRNGLRFFWWKSGICWVMLRKHMIFSTWPWESEEVDDSWWLKALCLKS